MREFFRIPIQDAEDDKLRSHYIRELVQKVIPNKCSNTKNNIPKVIVQFWNDLDEIPNDVQYCLDSWSPLEMQDFERILFDDDKARNFISEKFGNLNVEAFDLCNHPAMRCDYFRLCYIYANGGFYVDADEIYQGNDFRHLFYDDKLKLQPLCYDISSHTMIKPDIFITRRMFSPDWIFYINNNPLIAPAHHPIIRLAIDRATRILLDKRGKRLDIQSTTGPGNLTASLVRHSIESRVNHIKQDFQIIPDWESSSISPRELDYRKDERNWRNWRKLNNQKLLNN